MPNFVKIGQSVAKILRIKIFQFFKIAAVLIIGYDQCSSFYNMNISIFDVFGWKMSIHAPKIEVLGQFLSLIHISEPTRPY